MKKKRKQRTIEPTRSNVQPKKRERENEKKEKLTDCLFFYFNCFMERLRS